MVRTPGTPGTQLLWTAAQACADSSSLPAGRKGHSAASSARAGAPTPTLSRSSPHSLAQLAFLWRTFLSLSFMCPLLFLGTGGGFSVLRRTRQLPPTPRGRGIQVSSSSNPAHTTTPSHPLSEARTHSGAEPVSSSVQTRSQVMCKRRTGVRCGSCAAGTGHLGRQSHPWDMDPQNELWGQPKGLWEPCLLSLSTCR